MTKVGEWIESFISGFHLPRDRWEHQCGSVIITLKHLLTAAHCPEQFEKWKILDTATVRCGDHNLANSTDNYEGPAQTRRVRKALKPVFDRSKLSFLHFFS